MGELRLHFEALAVTSAPGQHLSVYGAEPGSTDADALVLLGRLPEHDPALTDRATTANEGERT
ncbi:hypothetical protein ACIO3R_25000 [Streptomyces sp. NPDC087428]|uniref:MmyB family transcriptional regulator n=1 Tax=Streptomyces sp. NPDC087428 TaxID=3365788 RepID=UPI00382816E8